MRSIQIMAFKLREFVVEFLQQNPKQLFTAREISEWIIRTYPDWCIEKKNRSDTIKYSINPEQAMIKQIIAEISSDRPKLIKFYPKIKTTNSRPIKYVWTESTIPEKHGRKEELKNPINKAKENDNTGADLVVNEKDLYPILSKFLKSELSIYSKRIDEKRSRNRRGPGANKWRHPDLVGMENISKDWDREIKDCVQQYSDKKSKLWSFEVKMAISLTNVRESYFQAVSNSSWANYGYLVGSKSVNQETMKELRMLSSLHGIGYIQLNLNNYIDSQIVIPARERPDIDWDIANRITEENRDFLEYIRLIRQFYQTGDLREIDWD